MITSIVIVSQQMADRQQKKRRSHEKLNKTIGKNKFTPRQRTSLKRDIQPTSNELSMDNNLHVATALPSDIFHNPIEPTCASGGLAEVSPSETEAASFSGSTESITSSYRYQYK